ncbi:MAG TPA: formyltransferase family protein [Pirellulales bacterium]|jgi:folate-dependent phosphoribosylglycinamide formyltransferase PurN
MINRDFALLRAAWDGWDGVDPLPDLRGAAQMLAGSVWPAPPPPRIRGQLHMQVKPALKSLTIPLLVDLRAALRASGRTGHVTAWAQTLLVVCEVRRTTLKQRLAVGDLSAEDLQIKFHLLVLFFLEYFSDSQDGRFVNLALKLLDQRWVLSTDNARRQVAGQQPPTTTAMLALTVHMLVEHAVAEMSTPKYRPSVCLNCTDRIRSVPNEVRRLDSQGKHVIVFSPNRYGLYTLAVTQLLLQAGVRVDAIVVRKLLNPWRMVTEFRRDGIRLLKKIWRKFFLRRRAYVPREYPTLPDLLARIGVTESSVDALAARHGIPVVYCTTLNEPRVHAALDQYRPDLVVFAGGGIVGDETLRRAGAGVVNCHMGQLPQYRGMDVVEWPLIENHHDDIGFTVHFMAHGIDTGDILGIFPVDGTLARTVYEYREKFEPLMAVAIADTVVGHLDGQFERRPQRLEDGKQYFIVHPRLYRMLEDRYVQSVAQVDTAPSTAPPTSVTRR